MISKEYDLFREHIHCAMGVCADIAGQLDDAKRKLARIGERERNGNDPHVQLDEIREILEEKE